MTKRSRWILVLSVVLCISMLFVSCESDVTDATETNTSDTETQATPKEPIPENEKIDYKNIFEKWYEYISFTAPEAEDAMGATKLYSYYDGSDAPYLAVKGMFYEATFTYGDESFGRTVKIFNKMTGQQIGNTYDNIPDGDTVYSFKYVGCVVEISTLVKATLTSEAVRTYDYYDINGNKINESPVAEEDRYELSASSPAEGYLFVTVEDKVYVVYENEILRIFKLGEERLLPHTNYEYGELRYYIPTYVEDEDDTIYVLDADNRICAHYKLRNAYDSRRISILANGNVLIEYENYCGEDEALYTYEGFYGEKILLYNVILDVTTGKTTEVPAEFRIDSILTPAISEESNIVFNGNYQYAEIRRIVDGKITAKTEPVILDNDMKILAELPLIVKNQESLIGALDEESLLVSGEALSIGSGRVIYRATAEGVELYVNEFAYDANFMPVYTMLKNGFIYNSTLYNDRMQPIYEFHPERENLILDGGRTILVEADEDDETVKKLLWIKDGTLKSVTLADEDDALALLDDGVRGFMVTVTDVIEPEEGEDEVPPVTSYAMYSNDGALLLKAAEITIVSDDNGSYLVRCVSDGTTSYYVVR